MYGYIDNIDFIEAPAEKYWSFPKTFKGNKKEETKYMIKTGDYVGSLKQDGHYARFIKDEDGNMILQGRTKSVSGEYLNKIEWVPQCQDFFDSIPNGTCFLGELYFPNQKGSRKVTTILGCLKNKALDRQNKGEKLCYYIFDVWAINGKSMLNSSIENRINVLNSFLETDYIKIAKYYEGEKLWIKLGEYLSNGEEGIVITKKGSKPEPGKRTSRKTLKIKQEINETIDAFLDGDYKPASKEYKGKELPSWSYWINLKTNQKVCECKYDEYLNGEPWEPITKAYYHGWAGAVSFSVMKNGEPCHIGYISGITDSLKREIVEEPEKWKNKVFELTAMEVEKSTEAKSGYSLRHGKIMQERPDKSYLNCDFSQICDGN